MVNPPFYELQLGKKIHYAKALTKIWSVLSRVELYAHNTQMIEVTLLCLILENELSNCGGEITGAQFHGAALWQRFFCSLCSPGFSACGSSVSGTFIILLYFENTHANQYSYLTLTPQGDEGSSLSFKTQTPKLLDSDYGGMPNPM